MFNTIDNQGVKDIPYPDIHFYGVDYMSIDKREDFLEWYDTIKDQSFDLQNLVDFSHSPNKSQASRSLVTIAIL